MAGTIEGKAPQYLSFTIAGTDYGLPILAVKEILQHEAATPVPGTPASVRGVINVRGQVVPVIDLAVRFGKPATLVTGRTCVLIVEASAGAERLTVGVLADSVNEVLDLAPEDTEATPSFGTDVRLEHLTGMGKVGRGFVLLLDVDRVLSSAGAETAGAETAGAAA